MKRALGLVEDGQGREHMRTLLKGTVREVAISDQTPLVIIGERINPAGKRRLGESLAQGDMSLVRHEASAQVEAGAHILDVNVSADDVDEERILPLAVQTVAEAVDVPICIDTSNHGAMAAALAVCPGRPLLNSVTGERASLETVLPLVKEHGCAVIGLCIDEKGIPKQSKGRLEIARKIIAASEAVGIPVEDVIIDPLAMTVGADHTSGVVTLEAVTLIRLNLGVNITLGGSNTSFGLPERSLIDRSFLAMAIAAGVTCAIVDPLDVEIRKTVAACDLLMGRDDYAMRFLQHARRGW